MLIPFKEVIERYGLTPSGVLHVGAWDGIEMETYAEMGITDVVFIEAQESIFDTLLARVSEYPNAKALRYCVSDNEEEVEFMVASNGQSSSLLALGKHSEIYPHIVPVDRIQMRTKTIEQIFDLERLDKVKYDFVNIDIQGAELKAIKGMGSMIDNVKCFYLEVNKINTYVGCALVGEIDDYLAQFGFQRVETSAWIDDCWADALYLRK